MSKNNVECLHFLSEAAEAVWGQKVSNGWSGINFHYSGPHQA